MTNTGDYYVRFDSNVVAWATEIETQVNKARGHIDGLLAHLETAGGKGVNVKVRDALTKDVTGGSGTTGLGTAPEEIKKALRTNADAIDHTTEALSDTIAKLKLAGEEIKNLPGSLRTTMGQIKNQIALAVREGTGAAVRDSSGVVRKGGTPEGDAAAVGAQLQRYLRGQGPGIGAAATRGVGGFGTSAGIRSIGTASLDKANFDRVITAIRAQTRVLAQTLPRRIEGGAINMVAGPTTTKTPTIPTAPTAPAAAEVMKPVLTARAKLLAEITEIGQSGRAVELDEAKSLVKRLGKELKKLDDDVAGLDEEAQLTRDEFRQARSNLRKIVAPAERAESGMTKAQQSEANRTAADQARKSKESITDLELADRLRKKMLVASPGEDVFQQRAQGKYTGETSPFYSKAELQEMAQAFESVGIAVKRTTKTTKEELGHLLQGAHREYQSRFPEGAEALRTSGFNIQRTTQVGEDLVSIVGDLGDRAKEIQDAQKVLKADYESGGKRKQVSERGEPFPGAIVVPPGMVKGRREVGAAIGDHGDSLYTEAEVKQAEQTLRADASRAMERVMELAKSATFDPHDLALNKQIQPGQGEADQALAQAAQNELRDTRLATTNLDAMGQEFLHLTEALATNADLIRRREKVLASLQTRDYSGPEGAEDRKRREELRGAQDEQARITARMRELGAGGRADLFRSPGYQQGLALRETGLGGPSEQARAHGFYLGEERSGADLQAKRGELVAQIKANEQQSESARSQIEAVDAETRAARAGSKEAEQLVDKYLRLVDVMEQCETNSSALARELGILDSILETTEEGAKKVARAVPGMGSRQAADASRTANARLPLFASDYRLLRSATGGAIAPVGTKAGAQQLRGAGLVPGLRFNEKEGTYYSAEQKLSRIEQEKLNAATGKLTKAQKDYFLLLSSGEASVEQLNASWARLEQAANKFANRIATSFGGLSPSIALLTGVHPLGEGQAYKTGEVVEGPQYSKKTTKDEARRQRARDVAEAERTKTIGADASPEQRLANAERDFANAQRRLEEANAKKAELVEDAAKQEAALGAATKTTPALDPRAKSEAIAKTLDAVQREDAAKLQHHRLLQLQKTQDAIHLEPTSTQATPPTKEDAATARERANIDKRAFEDARAEYDFAMHEYATRPKPKAAAARNRQEYFAQQNLESHADNVRRLQQVAQASAAVAGRTANLLKPEAFAREARRNQGGATAHLPSPEEFVGGYTPFVPGRKGPAGPEVPLQTVNQAVEIASAAVKKAETDLEAIAKPLGGLSKVRALAETLGRIEELEGQITGTGRRVRTPDDKGRVSGPRTPDAGLESAVEKAAKDVAKAQKKVGVEVAPAAKATEELATAERSLTQAEEGRVAALKKERAEIRAAGPYTKTARDALREQAGAAQRSASAQKGLATRYATSDPDRSAAAAAAAKTAQAEATALKAQAEATEVARQRIIKINQELKTLGAGRGAGGGGRVPPTGGSGPGGGFNEESNSILRQILGAVESVVTTLKGGVKVTGRAATAAGGTTAAAGGTRGPRVPVTTIGAAASPEEQTRRDNAFEAQQRRERQRARAVARDVSAEATEAERVQRAAERATTRQANSVRAQVRADAELAAATAEVSAATEQEILELARLTRAAEQATTAQQQLAAQQAIVAQQTKVAGAMAADLSKKGISATGQRQAIRTALSTAGPKMGAGEFESVMRAARPAASAQAGFTSVGQGYGQAMGTGVQSGFAKVFGGSSSFFDRILHTTGTFIVRNFAAGFVFGITNQLQQAVEQAIKTQQTFVRLSSTLEATGKDSGNLRVDLQSMSSAYGVSLNDLYDTAAKMAGVFETSADLTNGVKTVAQLQMISEGALSAEEAVGVLTSVWAAWGDELKKQGGAEHIADVATALQNLTGVNVEDIVEGMARLSGQAAQMSISAEETAAFVAQISRETNVTGATAGEQLSRILAQAQGGPGQTAIKAALGSDIFDRNTQNGAINYGAVLKQIIGDWDNLSTAQQENLTHALAGTRQAATFNALMDNGQKTLQNMTKAQNSQGAASERMASLMHTLNGEIARLGANFGGLVKNLLDTGLLNWVGILVELLNDILGPLNKLLAGMNQLGAENQLVGFFIKGTGTILGMYAAFILLTKAIRGLRAATAARGGGLASLLTMGQYGGGEQKIAGGAAGGRLTEAVAKGGIVATGGAAAAQTGLAAAMKGQTAAMLAQTAAEANLVKVTGVVGKTMSDLSAAEIAVTEAAGVLLEAKGALAKAELEGVASEERLIALNQAQMDAQLALTEAIGVHAATESTAAALVSAYEAEAVALAANVEAEAALAAANLARVATDAEIIALEDTLMTTEAALIAATEARIAADLAVAGASGGGLLTGMKAVGAGLLKWAGPIAAGVATTILLSKALMDQVHRVEKAGQESGGGAPESGAVGGEYRAAAKNYRDALKKSQKEESEGFFGSGVGPSLTKLVTRGIPLPGGGGTGLFADEYKKTDLHQENLDAIRESLRISARAIDQISRQEKKRQSGQAEASVPTFTSFDPEDMTKRFQELTDKGQTANQQLRELTNTLNGLGKSSGSLKAVTAGSYLARGRTTRDLNKVIQANVPGLQDILDKEGLSVDGLQESLQARLGTGYSSAKSELSGGIKLPTGPTKAGNTQEAIQRMKDEILARVEPSAEGSDYASRLKDLVEKYGKDSGQVGEYKKTHDLLEKFFYSDLHSYQTLLGQAVLTRKETLELIAQINDKADQALANLPESSLSGRSEVNRKRLHDAKIAVAHSTAPNMSQALQNLDYAESTYAESRFAEFDAVRRVAQAGTKDKKKIYAAGMTLIKRGIRLAFRHGDADLLAQVIEGGGKVALALAKAAMREVDAAYRAYQASIHTATAFTNAAVAENNAAISAALKPEMSPKDRRQLRQSLRFTPAVSSKDSDYLGGAFDDAAAAKDDANTLRADRAALVQARLGVKAAYADARGDAVAAAHIQVQIAKATMAAARADLGAAKSQSERLQALAGIANAEAGLIAAHAGVAQAHAELVSSQYDVAIALATAAGHTVQAAIRQAKQAEAALRLGLKKSGGKNTAEVNQLRASAISAESAVRDARLQDELDTIDFNLQMNRITQSSAIQALQHILKTEELTRAQRRSLLLQIKGMKDEMANSQWNFSDIKLPTPYQMRRYIEQRKKQFRNDMDAAAGGTATKPPAGDHGTPQRGSTTTNNTTYIRIDGADYTKVKRLVTSELAKPGRVVTGAPRRRV